MPRARLYKPSKVLCICDSLFQHFTAILSQLPGYFSITCWRIKPENAKIVGTIQRIVGPNVIPGSVQHLILHCRNCHKICTPSVVVRWHHPATFLLGPSNKADICGFVTKLQASAAFECVRETLVKENHDLLTNYHRLYIKIGQTLCDVTC